METNERDLEAERRELLAELDRLVSPTLRMNIYHAVGAVISSSPISIRISHIGAGDAE